MDVVFVDGGQEWDLSLRVGDPSATAGDLLTALAPGAGGDAALLVDERRVVPRGVALADAGLCEGATLRVLTDPAARRRRDHAGRGGRAGVVHLDVIGGLDAGRRHPLPVGTVEVGRSPACAVSIDATTVSRHHLRVSVTSAGRVSVEDLGSRNGTWLGRDAVAGTVALTSRAVVRVGAVQVSVRAHRADDRPHPAAARGSGGTGTVPFNRPPRPASPPDAVPVAAPVPPSEPARRNGVSIASVVVPIAMAALLVVLLDNLTFALFALLGPVMLIGGAFEQRRRGARTSRRARARYRSELSAFGAGLDDAAAVELDRRLDAFADLTEVIRRAEVPSVRLWERRPGHHDFLALRLGLGDLCWLPPLIEAPGPRRPELDAALGAHGTIIDAPVGIELGAGAVVGVVGERAPALALVRALVCQAAVHHGPADLGIAVLASAAVAVDWDWAKWLPHSRTGEGSLLRGDVDGSTALAQAMVGEGPERSGRTVLVVVDDESLLEGRRSPVRMVLRGDGGPVGGIVLASTVDRLPAVCSVVVELRGPDGEAVVHRPQSGRGREQVLVAGCGADTARRCARAVSRYEDPELEVAGAGLPDRVGLLAVLGLDGSSGPGALASRLSSRWAEGGSDPPLRAPLGVTEDGVLHLDLAADGPHALVAGTTGAGKSELLRSLVASLAAVVSPEHLTFVLIDFKGGSAFDACARLPHTVGMVTDLDEHLAARALRCLEAELRHRERVLRASGATDLHAHRRLSAATLPHLVVVIDEFATLKAELPTFVDALVGIAQRGRSLGVHLVLATQRPAGAVSDNIKANANLRIALRVQDAGDSSDVIGSPVAAELPRTRAGRAYVRLGPSELELLQCALATGPVRAGPPPPVELRPFGFGSDGAFDVAMLEEDGGPSELDELVDAALAAFVASGVPAPRRPWPEPLPAEVDLDALDGACFALADDPDGQCQVPHGWRRADGNLLLVGIGGSGTTTALVSIALALSSRCGPDRLHLYAMDFGAGDLAPLSRLPHTGAVIHAGERERQARLVRHLRAELERRRSSAVESAPRAPEIVVLLDGYAAFASEFSDAAGMAVLDDLVRVLADGPDVGIRAVVAADRVGAVPSAVAALIRQRLIFRLAEPHDFAAAGVAGPPPARLEAGRAIDVETRRVVQLARPSRGVGVAVDAIAAHWPAAARPDAPAPIGELPRHVRVSDIARRGRLDQRPWFVPIGIGERALEPAGLVLYEGEHALIAGPARSGRSTTLCTIAAVVAAQQAGALVISVAGPRSPLAGCGVDEAIAAVAGHDGPALLLVDDAEQVEDRTGALAALVARAPAHVHVVAAGRSEVLRTAYQHWTRGLRRSRSGLLLAPNPDLDGELLGQVLPRRAPVTLGPGRGWLVDGSDLEVVQVATLDDA